MKKLTFLLISFMVLAFAACNDDEKGSYPPTYQGFRYQPAVVHAGDSVVITAVQQKKGHYLNATNYTWSMTILVNNNGEAKSEELNAKKHTNYGGIDSSDPEWRIMLPPNTIPGTYTCKFAAEWSNSADGVGGIFNGGTSEGCTGTIESQSYVLYSKASGSFRLQVQ